MQATTKQNENTDLKERAIKLLEKRKATIKEFSEQQPNHPFAIANKNILDATPETLQQASWDGTGEVSMTGVLWWALNLGVDFAPPNCLVFNASGGPDADIAIFTSAVTGFFYVDPSTLGGQYNFKLQCVTASAGEVTIDLYSSDWNQQIGSFVGVSVGLSASYISGSGNLTYNPSL